MLGGLAEQARAELDLAAVQALCEPDAHVPERLVSARA